MPTRSRQRSPSPPAQLLDVLVDLPPTTKVEVPDAEIRAMRDIERRLERREELLVDVVENPGHGGRVPRVDLQKSKGSTIVSEQNRAVVFAARSLRRDMGAGRPPWQVKDGKEDTDGRAERLVGAQRLFLLPPRLPLAIPKNRLEDRSHLPFGKDCPRPRRTQPDDFLLDIGREHEQVHDLRDPGARLRPDDLLHPQADRTRERTC